MQNIRVWLEKRGRAKYISHLDLMRAMSRAVRRARLPVWYTEGFHPHPYLSFPLPLPLGQEGAREPLDLRLEQPVPLDDIAARLGRVLPEGLRVLAVREPLHGPGEIAAARYELLLPCAGDMQAEALRLEGMLAGGALTAKKLGKQGRRKVEKEIPLSPLVLRYELEAGEALRLRCTLAAGSEMNLNPALLAGALGIASPAITRLRLLRADGEAWE